MKRGGGGPDRRTVVWIRVPAPGVRSRKCRHPGGPARTAAQVGRLQPGPDGPASAAESLARCRRHRGPGARLVA
eukprot:385030-Hanusia_phi.AAC.1